MYCALALQVISFLRTASPDASGGPFFSVLPEKNGEKRGAGIRNSAAAPKRHVDSAFRSSFVRPLRNVLRAAHRISLIWNVGVRQILDVWKSIRRMDFKRIRRGGRPSAAVGDEGALRMRHAPCGCCPPAEWTDFMGILCEFAAFPWPTGASAPTKRLRRLCGKPTFQ